MTYYAYKITINNKIDVILSTSSTAHWFYNHKEVDNNNNNIMCIPHTVSRLNATSCETSSIFYCPKVNNTRHNKYNSSPVEGICDV